MTIIQDRIEDVAGDGLSLPVTFTVQVVRESAGGDAIVTPVRHRFDLVDGALTTSDLDPGPAVVVIPGASGGRFEIVIPVSSSPVRLWPLIDAGMPPPPAESPGFVRDGGGVARVQAVTAAQYAAMTHDPATLYIFMDEETL